MLRIGCLHLGLSSRTNSLGIHGNRSEVSHEIGGDDGTGSGVSALTIVRLDTHVHHRPDPALAVPEGVRSRIRRMEASAR